MTLEDLLQLGKKKRRTSLLEELGEGMLDTMAYADAPHEFDSRRILDNDECSVFLDEELDSDNEGNDTDDLGISGQVDVPDWKDVRDEIEAERSFDDWVVKMGLSVD